MTNPTEFQSEFLSAIAAELQARSKGIAYHAASWSCTRELEPSDNAERLNIDIQDWSKSQWRISFWTEGQMWFRVCQGRAKNGWDFLLIFHGDCREVPPEQLVESLKESITRPKEALLDV